jgi:hypothetical protein
MAVYRDRTQEEYLAAVQRFVARTRRMVDKRGYYPRDTVHTDTVLLALLSKGICVSEAICHLVEGGYQEEAFGLLRTLLDLAFNLRFIVNKDIDERAKLYYNFYSQSTLHWVKVADEYYPGMPKPPEMPKIQNVAMQYKSPHHWAGQHMTAKAIAMEPDTKEMDEKGEPVSYKFWYDVIFRWTSHFVHPSIAGLHSHLVRPGNEVFRVHRHKDLERIEFGRLSLHSLVATLGQMTTQFLRGMGEEYDGHLGTYALRLLQAPRPVIH